MRIYPSALPTIPDLPETSVFEYIFSNPNRRPDSHVCLIDGDTGEKVTREDLKSGSLRLAHGLHHKLHLQPGQTACVFSPNTILYHKILFGLQCAGITVSPANSAYLSSELRHQLSDSGSAVVFVHPSRLEVVEEAVKGLHGWGGDLRGRIVLAVRRGEEGVEARGKGYMTVDELMGGVGEELEPFKVGDPRERVAYLCYSSGTTGLAKGVMTTHYNMTSNLAIHRHFVGCKNDTIMGFLPFSHIFGLSLLIHWPIFYGARVVIMSKFEIGNFCSLIERYQATLAMVVPPVMILLANHPVIAQYDMSSLDTLFVGAAPLGYDLQQRVSRRLPGTNIVQGLGITETTGGTHFCPKHDPAPGSVGVPYPNVETRIVDPESGLDVDEGLAGEMWIRSPVVMKGYHNLPDKTGESIVQGGWFKTGDAVKVTRGGHFVVVDRIKELIKYKGARGSISYLDGPTYRRSFDLTVFQGFQVAPAEMEDLLVSHPKISDAACIGIWSETQATELPRAYVVPSTKISDPRALCEEIQDWVASKVASHKKLRGGVLIIDAIPKSPSGKILRRILKERVNLEEARLADSQAKL